MRIQINLGGTYRSLYSPREREVWQATLLETEKEFFSAMFYSPSNTAKTYLKNIKLSLCLTN
jgi:hypothetical protein